MGTCPGLVQHVIFCALAKQDAAARIPQLFSSEKVQHLLKESVGLVGIEVIMQADQKMFMHARFISEQAFQASDMLLQDVVDSLSDVLEEKQQQFKAVGGRVKLAGSQLCSFPNAR